MKMQACLTVAMVALLPVLGFSTNVAAVSSLTFDMTAAKNRPVSKVITLIKDMLKQLEKEAEEDQEIYDKMACWCETNDKEKTKSIADAETRIARLTTKSEELTASSARLGQEIKNLEKEVASNQKALAEATAIREKQLAEFNEEEKDLLGSISALKAAITVLEKHHSSLLQMPQTHAMGIAATIQNEMKKHATLLQGVLTRKERRALAAFVQAAPGFSTPESNYAPQSGQIFGILRQMKDTFEANLSDSQKEEQANQKAYDDLKAAKEAEIAAGQSQIEMKTQERADADELNAHTKQDIEDTKASLAADEEFLAMLKEKCAMTDSEWNERTKTRNLEIEACSKALEVLSGDDAHDLFTKTFNKAFVQKESATHSERRAQASKLLARVASKVHSPRLSTLAVQVRLDAFTKVKKAIDDMVADLLAEKASEIKHKDFCVAEFNENAAQTEDKEREKKDLIAKQEDLEMRIKELTRALTTLKNEIAEMQVQMKRAGEDREIENKEFQMTVADQRATQKLLHNALTVLEGFYGKQALLQKQPAGPPPPAGFKEYKNNQNSGGVMGMISQIIEDAKAMEEKAIRSEEDAQGAYENMVKETNASIEEKTKDIVNKSEDKANDEDALVTTKGSKAAVLKELEDLSNYNAELHGSCDFVMKNFDLRQTARDEEIEALKQANQILSGANFQAFLQG